MNKNRRIPVSGGFPHNIERRMIEIATIRTVTMIVGIDVGPNLNATQSKLANTTRQLPRGKIDILQRTCAEPGKMRWILADNAGDVIVEKAAQVQRIARFRPVTEHDWHG